MRTNDCFLFFNEFDLLELRLKTLESVVDQFVLVEGSWTFSGRFKPLHFKDNISRFAKWPIRHVVFDYRVSGGAWAREHATRDAIVDGLHDAAPDDLIFISDVDEIWRPEAKTCLLGEYPVLTFGMTNYYYRLNTARVPHVDWPGTKRLRFRDWTSAQAVRSKAGPAILGAGWHFSFLGNAKNAQEKMMAFSHTEYSGDDWTNLKRLTEKIEAGEDVIDPTAKYVPVPVDQSFPKPLQDDPKRWEHLIQPVQEA